MSKVKYHTYLGNTVVVLNNHKELRNYLVEDRILREHIYAQIENNKRIPEAIRPKLVLEPMESTISEEDYLKLSSDLIKISGQKNFEHYKKYEQIRVYCDLVKVPILLIKRRLKDE